MFLYKYDNKSVHSYFKPNYNQLSHIIRVKTKRAVSNNMFYVGFREKMFWEILVYTNYIF